ncbi:MAG: DUF2141 domain-containing protein [Myxococcota bacterium]
MLPNPRRTAVGVLLLALVFPGAAGANELRVQLRGIESADGEVRCGVFIDQESLDASRYVHRMKAPAEEGVVELVFEDVAPGRYGVNAFHDENGNETLDRNLVGIPREPYGFSNNARGSFGPPGFDAVSFEMGTEPKTIQIDLR